LKKKRKRIKYFLKIEKLKVQRPGETRMGTEKRKRSDSGRQKSRCFFSAGKQREKTPPFKTSV
jgi:hypothetical protein